jgi:hypothetical protein
MEMNKPHGATETSPQSPGCTLTDFIFWGVPKDKVYSIKQQKVNKMKGYIPQKHLQNVIDRKSAAV